MKTFTLLSEMVPRRPIRRLPQDLRVVKEVLESVLFARNLIREYEFGDESHPALSVAEQRLFFKGESLLEFLDQLILMENLTHFSLVCLQLMEEEFQAQGLWLDIVENEEDLRVEGLETELDHRAVFVERGEEDLVLLVLNH